jgi:hypothetical protein
MLSRSKKMGRPATGHDPVTAIRLSGELKALIDRWRTTQPDKPPRSEAIRRLILTGLAAPKKGKIG